MLTTDIKIEVYTRPFYMTQHAIVLCVAVKPDLCLPANNVDSTSSHTPQTYPRHRLARLCLQHTLPQKYPRHWLARPRLQHTLPQKYPRHRLARPCRQHASLRNILDIDWQDTVSNTHCLRNILDINWQDCVFNMHCLRNILDIDWQDHVSNYNVLTQKRTASKFAMLHQGWLRVFRHVSQIDGSWIPLYG